MDIFKAERIKWEKWAKKIEEYSKELSKLISEWRDKDEDRFYHLKNGLDKHYGRERLLVGPWTEITSPEDIKEMFSDGFILPGDQKLFSEKYAYEDLLKAYGKHVVSDIGNSCGKVIGYGYDAMDDYFVVITDSGDKKYLILNSPYKIIEDEEKEET